MTPLAAALVVRTALTAAALLGGAGALTGDAHAVSLKVKLACAGDYYSYCSDHSPDSPGVRQCMRANGLKLSRSCVDALVSAGEVSKEEVARRAASAR
jgi:hypothetical protein